MTHIALSCKTNGLIFSLCLLIALTKSAFADELSNVHLRTINGLYYQKDHNKPFTGKYINYWDKDHKKKKNEVYIKEGLHNGVFLGWREDGKKALKHTLKNGQLDGKWTSWYKSGNKHEIGAYKKDKKTDAWITWYENGNKRSEENYLNGMHHGAYIEWYENGNLKAKTSFTDGLIHGEAKGWFESGALAFQGIFDYGAGKYTEWRNGRIFQEGNYEGANDISSKWFELGDNNVVESPEVIGIKEGVWTWYDETGNKASQVEYHNGEAGIIKAYTNRISKPVK